jgi:hypothetical protein
MSLECHLPGARCRVPIRTGSLIAGMGGFARRRTLPAGTTLEALALAWPGFSSTVLSKKPLFFTAPPVYTSSDLIQSVATHLEMKRS